MGAKYDIIGLNYAELRKPDARIAAAIQEAIGQAKTVLNVGAGTGSYEPVDRRVTAVEPSLEMIRKRSSSAANVIQASADQLPFEDDAFEAAMAILTVHHWPDKKAGLQEMRRVTRGRIVYRCRTIAAMGSCMRIGVARAPISIPGSAPAVPRSGHSAISNRDWRDCSRIWKRANGSAGTPSCSRSTRMTPDIGSC